MHFEGDGDGISSVQVLGVVGNQLSFGKEADIVDAQDFRSFLVLRSGGGEVFVGAHDEEEGDDASVSFNIKFHF